MQTLNQRNRPNTMRPMTFERGEGGVAHRVYDLSIENMQERREKSRVFPTALQTTQFLGMVENKISYWRERGRKFYSKKHDKVFAIRMEKEIDA